jgi:circadian clock protein KaiC
VIFLDHRVTEQTSTRRLRIVKYRGSLHGTNEYPFLIDEEGISILPITSLSLDHGVSTERVSTGIARLDEMLGGRGYYKGSSVLVSGTSGTGKTSVAALLAESACQRGKRCLFFAFEESTDQILRNMRSIGVRLEPFVSKGLLEIITSRPTAYGLERHLLQMHKAVGRFQPDLVVVDPITNLVSVGTSPETRAMMTRLIDFLKARGTTSFFTSLTAGSEAIEESEVGISSLIDTWLSLQVLRSGGERNRTLTIIKSRGMAHSNQTAEFRLTSRGVELLDTYLGSAGVLTGSARLAQEAEDRAALAAASAEIERKQEERERRRKSVERQITELREQLAAEDSARGREIDEGMRRLDRLAAERNAMGLSRHAFASGGKQARGRRP